MFPNIIFIINFTIPVFHIRKVPFVRYRYKELISTIIPFSPTNLASLIWIIRCPWRVDCTIPASDRLRLNSDCKNFMSTCIKIHVFTFFEIWIFPTLFVHPISSNPFTENFCSKYEISKFCWHVDISINFNTQLWWFIELVQIFKVNLILFLSKINISMSQCLSLLSTTFFPKEQKKITKK